MTPEQLTLLAANLRMINGSIAHIKPLRDDMTPAAREAVNTLIDAMRILDNYQRTERNNQDAKAVDNGT